jgi:hypothetical protein
MTTTTTVVVCRPLTRTPRHPRIACSTCPATAPNEDRARRDWRESAGTPPRYRCSTCVSGARLAEDAGTPFELLP